MEPDQKKMGEKKRVDGATNGRGSQRAEGSVGGTADHTGRLTSDRRGAELQLTEVGTKGRSGTERPI